MFLKILPFSRRYWEKKKFQGNNTQKLYCLRVTIPGNCATSGYHNLEVVRKKLTWINSMKSWPNLTKSPSIVTRRLQNLRVMIPECCTTSGNKAFLTEYINKNQQWTICTYINYELKVKKDGVNISAKTEIFSKIFLGFTQGTRTFWFMKKSDIKNLMLLKKL